MENEGKHSPHHGWKKIYTGKKPAYSPIEPNILVHLKNIKIGKSIDIGCGTGDFCITLAKKGWETTGLDITPEAISIAKENAIEQKVNANFIVADASIWKPEESYDLVTCNFGVPPEIEKRKDIYKTIKNALKPEGIVFFVIGKNDINNRSERFSGYNSLNIEELKQGFNEFKVEKIIEIELNSHKHGGKEMQDHKKPAVIFMARKK